MGKGELVTVAKQLWLHDRKVRFDSEGQFGAKLLDDWDEVFWVFVRNRGCVGYQPVANPPGDTCPHCSWRPQPMERIKL